MKYYVKHYLSLSADGSYTDFGKWSECSAFCGEGNRTRTRTCTKPAPAHGGADCVGDPSEHLSCKEVNCSGLTLSVQLHRWAENLFNALLSLSLTIVYPARTSPCSSYFVVTLRKRSEQYFSKLKKTVVSSATATAEVRQILPFTFVAPKFVPHYRPEVANFSAKPAEFWFDVSDLNLHKILGSHLTAMYKQNYMTMAITLR